MPVRGGDIIKVQETGRDRPNRCEKKERLEKTNKMKKAVRTRDEGQQTYQTRTYLKYPATQGAIMLAIRNRLSFRLVKGKELGQWVIRKEFGKCGGDKGETV